MEKFMPTALISVSDKQGIITFTHELQVLGWNIIASSGTTKLLRQANVNCQAITEYIDYPEILDGRVKTLNPKIYGGILAIRNNNNHMKQLHHYKIDKIDMVVVNLYPFETIISKIHKPINKIIDQQVIENIDIGGVSLLRAAAKNYRDVIVICDSSDYESIIINLKNNTLSDTMKLGLAAKAFRYTSYYDSLIAEYFTYDNLYMCDTVTIPLKKISALRYGENPHQRAALYSCNNNMSCKQINGKELSYNNYLDVESASRVVNEFDKPTCVIIKHNNPCGCASNTNLKEAYIRALECDITSAFGGVIAFNKEIDDNTAIELNKLFIECIIAPKYSGNAVNILTKKKNIRLLIQNELMYNATNKYTLRMTDYGILIQEQDNQLVSEFKIATIRKPNEIEICSLNFALKIAKHVKSNAIVLVRGEQTVGIGAGQMSRIDSLKIASNKMSVMKSHVDETLLPLVLASDAFFPFADVVELAYKLGVKAIIQPGGSIKDDDSIQAANEHNMTMIMTGIRHFRH
ncbi:MAG: bifunctional phosphoribosylaminoimidazolecarboxamide formyltransferase/IMP cyclohydrolase [Endomicrobium sp.]|jgi:phosphoribosylaminoimidazolecarboxamide formyltransferase/IMP cyclohydrolase|nr:bifunctional phosphoribosylaminoimidazolecarboxamide formyltransferase/IMP cyclohydrolase [Endomicrobium sp.]